MGVIILAVLMSEHNEPLSQHRARIVLSVPSQLRFINTNNFNVKLKTKPAGASPMTRGEILRLRFLGLSAQSRGS